MNKKEKHVEVAISIPKYQLMEMLVKDLIYSIMAEKMKKVSTVLRETYPKKKTMELGDQCIIHMESMGHIKKRRKSKSWASAHPEQQ